MSRKRETSLEEYLQNFAGDKPPLFPFSHVKRIYFYGFEDQGGVSVYFNFAVKSGQFRIAFEIIHSYLFDWNAFLCNENGETYAEIKHNSLWWNDFVEFLKGEER